MGTNNTQMDPMIVKKHADSYIDNLIHGMRLKFYDTVIQNLTLNQMQTHKNFGTMFNQKHTYRLDEQLYTRKYNHTKRRIKHKMQMTKTGPNMLKQTKCMISQT